jgi:hypothetical protein
MLPRRSQQARTWRELGNIAIVLVSRQTIDIFFSLALDRQDSEMYEESTL